MRRRSFTHSAAVSHSNLSCCFALCYRSNNSSCHHLSAKSMSEWERKGLNNMFMLKGIQSVTLSESSFPLLLFFCPAVCVWLWSCHTMRHNVDTRYTHRHVLWINLDDYVWLKIETLIPSVRSLRCIARVVNEWLRIFTCGACKKWKWWPISEPERIHVRNDSGTCRNFPLAALRDKNAEFTTMLSDLLTSTETTQKVLEKPDPGRNY